MKKKISEAPKELFIVVDENDTVIDYLPRAVVHKSKDIIHRTVAILIFNDKGEILLQKRSKHKDKFPLKYTVSASGHVSKGETYESAAKKELKEELGITLELNFEAKSIKKDYYETEMMAVFTGFFNGPFNFDPIEVDSIKFFTIEQAKKRFKDFSPSVEICLKLINKI